MAIGKGNPGRSVVIIRRQIRPRIAMFHLGGEVADVVDAVRMLVHIHPSLRRTGIVQARHVGSESRIVVGIPSNTSPAGQLTLWIMIAIIADADVA